MLHRILGKLKERLLDRKRQRETLIFLAKFLALSIPLYLIVWLGVSLGFLQTFVANFTTAFLNAVGIPATVSGITISLPNFAGYIAWDCTGWKSMIAFIALVVATDTTWRKRAYGLLLLPVIFAINLLRVFGTFYIAYTQPSLYTIVHQTLWSWGLIAIVLILWVLWLRFIARAKRSI